MNAITNLTSSLTVAAPATERALGYHGAVCDFKRRLIEATLHQVCGNRTHAARALGLQRTYLLRLMRELRVTAPPPPPRGRAAAVR
jgi:DNA-binding NtrC family response regulator